MFLPVILLCTVLGQLIRDQVIQTTMRPYTGPSRKGVDRSTLQGKVLCGYQGWFTAPGDGSDRGWFHWSANGDFRPGNCKIDLWPDVSELGPDERYKTAFTLPDGKPAEVFSSFRRQTVLRHFRWMQTYGIDGVFVQRFITQTFDPLGLRQVNVVLDHCREGANLYGRTYAVMYDLSGLQKGEMERVEEDWKLLVDRMHITSDPAYLHDGGRPVVAVWGLGFNDGRKYTVQEGMDLVTFLHKQGCEVMLGVPTYWRTLDRDAVNDPALLELIAQADVVSPWTVGRYATPEAAAAYASGQMSGDVAWCKEHGKKFMPVVFPGFSWHNMFPKSPSNQIPRLKGKFLEAQYRADIDAGARTIYQAMFDEVDEGTAIFKVTNDPPVGPSPFVSYEGLPSDYYLKLCGEWTGKLREER